MTLVRVSSPMYLPSNPAAPCAQAAFPTAAASSSPNPTSSHRRIALAPFPPAASGADFLPLERDVGDHKNDDRAGDQPGQLRPHQDKALRGRQRPRPGADQLAQIDQAEKA